MKLFNQIINSLINQSMNLFILLFSWLFASFSVYLFIYSFVYLFAFSFIYLLNHEIFSNTLKFYFLCFLLLWLTDHSFNTTKFPESITFLTPWYAHVSTYVRTRGLICVYEGVRNVSFSENFAYVLNELSLILYSIVN